MIKYYFLLLSILILLTSGRVARWAVEIALDPFFIALSNHYCASERLHRIVHIFEMTKMLNLHRSGLSSILPQSLSSSTFESFSFCPFAYDRRARLLLIGSSLFHYLYVL